MSFCLPSSLPKRNRMIPETIVFGPSSSARPRLTSNSGAVPSYLIPVTARTPVVTNTPPPSAIPSPPSTSSSPNQPDHASSMDYIVESGSSTVVATAQNKQAMVDNDNASEIAGSRGEEEEVVKLLSIEKLDWVMPEHLVMGNGRPPIWSSSRQGLVEGVPYFNCYQGGVSHKAGRAYGYLLDGNPSPNDICSSNGKVIISHGGGSSERSAAGGSSFQLKKDQTMLSAQMAALLNCCRLSIPIVLMAGHNYLSFMWLKENGFRYVILGYYIVTHIWPSIEFVQDKGGELKQFTRLLVRFEWVGSQGSPWFDDIIGGQRCDNPPMPINNINLPLPSLQTCPNCFESFTPIYMASITCYNVACLEFFKIGSELADATELLYTNAILGYAPSNSSPLVPRQLVPGDIYAHALRANDQSHSLEAWKEASHCSSCGQLNVRSEWNRIACASASAQCPSIDLVPRIYSMNDLRIGGSSSAGSGSKGKSRAPKCYRGLSCTEVVIEGFTGWLVTLPHGRGRIYQLMPNDLDEADRLLEEYQAPSTSNLFVRQPLANSPCAGPLRTNHFTFNSGVHYSFAANVKTISLVDSPAPVLSCLTALIWAAEQIVQVRTDALFNEILSVGYKNGGKMNYHNDGEEAVGPVIATMSLGSRTRMQFRERAGKKSSSDGHDSLLKEGQKHHPAIVKLELLHGDILIMEGDKFQVHYEHCIDPTSGLRFAATARKLVVPR